MKEAVSVILELAGAALVVGGLWLVWPPVALVAAGVVAIVAAQAIGGER